ncbi:HDOD domain-containing protein [Pseudomonas putida]|nr:HDOD domain-containing protein [Pseudomonas putida]
MSVQVSVDWVSKCAWNPQPDAPGIDMPTYWKMGLHTAFMASFLAESIGADRDVAFTTGLMQGIGALLIHLVIPEEACVVVESVDPFDFAGRRPVEQIQLGFDNAEVGAELLKRWKFPAPIQKALQTYSNRSPLPDILGQLLSVSSTYAYGVVMGLDRSSLADQMDTEIINSLGLTHDLLDTCRQRVSESVLMIG